MLDYEIIKEFNQTETPFPADKTIHELFEETAKKYANKVALSYNFSQLTYRELNEKSNRIAHFLKTKNRGNEHIVSVFLPRSLDLIVAFLGILKAGAAYLPVDVSYPAPRIELMLSDSGTSCIITRKELQHNLPEAIPQFTTDEDLPQIQIDTTTEHDINTQPTNLAYVIYTSGTTGRPKGVMLEHRGFVNMILYQISSFGITPQDTVLQFASASFDACAYETFLALLAGASLVVIDKATINDTEKFTHYLQEQKVTTVVLPPVYLNALEQHPLPTVTTIITAGEACNVNDALYYSKFKNYVNAYGPSETSVCASFHKVETGRNYGKVIPIGKPIANTQLYVVDEQMNLLPPGQPGELCIGGIGVGRGYINRPELTARKFVQNPWKSGEKMYRTGDLVQWLHDGNIEFLGRIDHQVKIRGNRVELEEIENWLLKHEAIKNAVVIAETDSNNPAFLLAYYISSSPLELPELRDYMRKHLPSYMIPSYFVQLEDFPLTPNGKIDRKALPRPQQQGVENDKETGFETLAESQLASIWRSVLNVNRIERDDDFFLIGGHSLKANILMHRIKKEMHVAVSVDELFEYSGFEEMVQLIDNKDKKEFENIPPAPVRAAYPLSPAQKRMYFLSYLESASITYNVSPVIEIHVPVVAENIEQVLKNLIQRHESLRTSFEMRESDAVQVIHPTVDFSLQHYTMPENEALKAVKNFSQPFDLSKAPLFRGALFTIDPDFHLLVWDLHHIVADGTSVGILLEEFAAMYEKTPLPPVTTQYKDFVEWQNNFLESPEFQKQRAYWMQKFAGDIPELELPVDFSRNRTSTFTGERYNFTIDAVQTAAINQLLHQTDTTLFMFAMAAYHVLLAKYTNQSDFVIGTGTANRQHADLQQMVGMFVNLLPLRNTIKNNQSFLEFLQSVKQSVLEAFAHQDYPFDQLISDLGLSGSISKNPLFSTLLIVQNIDFFQLKVKALKAVQYENATPTSKFDVSVFIVPRDNYLDLQIEYNTSLFKEDTIAQVANRFSALIELLTENPSKNIESIQLFEKQNDSNDLLDSLSDFEFEL